MFYHLTRTGLFLLPHCIIMCHIFGMLHRFGTGGSLNSIPIQEIQPEGTSCIPQVSPQTYFISTQGTGQHQARLFGRKEMLILCKPLTTLGHHWVAQHRYPDVLLQQGRGGWEAPASLLYFPCFPQNCFYSIIPLRLTLVRCFYRFIFRHGPKYPLPKDSGSRNLHPQLLCEDPVAKDNLA